MATRRICEFLDGNSVQYAVMNHHRVFTAQEQAQAARIAATYMAKTVIVWIDDKLAMAVVPANQVVDLERLREATQAEFVRVAEESEFADRFTGCQLGTVPPFGTLFGLPTYYDPTLARHQCIAFAAGTHTNVIVMAFADYNRLVRPKPIEMAISPCSAVCAHF